MNSASKHAVVTLLVIAITGCTEKPAKTAPPAQAQAPALSTGKAGALYPPPLTQAPAQPEQQKPAPAPAVANAAPAPPPPPPPTNTGKTSSKRKSKPSAAKPSGAQPASTPASNPDTTAAPAQATATGTPAPTEATTDVAGSGEPAAASPIGQLTTGGAASQIQTRKETSDLIANTENGLNGIKRTLDAQEQETATQIRTFLTKAKQALSNEDLDGAFTLATKAKVLLDELNKT